MLDAQAWWRCIEINLRGPFLCARAVLPGMVARGRGRIIATASNAGLAAHRYGSGYGISKTALIRLTGHLAVETKEHGVSVFTIGPGFVRAAMTEHLAASPEDERWDEGRFARNLEEGRYLPSTAATWPSSSIGGAPCTMPRHLGRLTPGMPLARWAEADYYLAKGCRGNQGHREIPAATRGWWIGGDSGSIQIRDRPARGKRDVGSVI